MMFCPKCGSLLRPKIDKKKKVMACSCGYTNKDAAETTIKEQVVNDDKQVSIVSDNEEIYPETDAKCPDCGNERAYYWTVQTRAGDEPETKFLKCKKCKNVWRDYS